MDFTSPAPPIAWQAIKDANGSLVGHEIFNRSRTASAHTIDSDLALAHAVLSHVQPVALLDNGLLFLNTTYESLRGAHLDLLPANQIVLEIPSLGHAASSEVEARRPALEALRAKGFALAFNHSVLDSAYTPWHDLINYLKIDFSVLAADRAVLMIQWARRIRGATLVADKIETTAQLQLAQENAVDLLQGYAVSRPEPVPARVLLPSITQTNSLVEQLNSRAETATLQALLQSQPALLFNLLRMARSMGLAGKHSYASLEQLLGALSREQLKAWAGMLQAVATEAEAPALCQRLLTDGSGQLMAAATQQWPQVPAESLQLVCHALLLGQILGLAPSLAAEQLLPPALSAPVQALAAQWQVLLPPLPSDPAPAG